jgi:hypothetical protein
MKQIENVLTLLGAAERDITLASKMIKGATRSYTRLGDFQVARSAIARVSSCLEFLIVAETGSLGEPDPEEDIAVPVDSPRGQELLMEAERKTRVAELTRAAVLGPKRLGGRTNETPKAAAPAKKADVQKTVHPGGSVNELILELLKFEPRTPTELHQAMNRKRPGTPIASVYTGTSSLKGQGAIVSIVGEEDGTRRWHLKK